MASHLNKGAAIHFIWVERPGIFRGIKNASELLAMRGIVSVAPIVMPGAKVQSPASNGDHVAEILTVGRTAAEACANVKAAHSKARLMIE